jgi:diguanylate cyclase (GGDEF)-like protein
MPRRWWYTALAMVMAAGAPIGLAALRLFWRRRFTLAEVSLDVQADPLTYAYVALSTTIAFAGFGYVLGMRADQLLERSLQDPLTGLANWRLLHDRLRQEVSRVRRHGQPLALLLFDLDGLKSINDAHGHPAGSAALMRLAETLRRGARADDTTARWGGDEFALLAPGTSLEAGIALGERLRAEVEAWGEGSAGVRFTVSVGVAGVRPPLGDLEQAAARLWEDADAALYAAKKRGRNCVCSSAPGVPA